MVSNSKKNKDECNTLTVTEVKAKRGRKSKKELMATLNISEISPKEKNNTSYQKQNIINFNVSELKKSKIDNQNHVYEDILNDDSTTNNENIILDETNQEITNIIYSLENTGEEIKIPK
jgi:hypothetical protein